MKKGYFLGLAEAKAFFGVSSFDVRRNKNNNKLSILLPGGIFMRIQQDIDTSQPMAVLTEEVDELTGQPDWHQGCLINTSGGSLEEAMSI